MSATKQIMLFPIKDIDGNKAGIIAAVRTVDSEGGISPDQSIFLKASDTNEKIGAFVRASFDAAGEEG